MLERILLPRQHAIAILLKDHDAVQTLFNRFERAKSPAEKDRIVRDAILELKIHASIEEEIFYPAVREHVGKDVMNEADEEHHVARVLIAELDRERRSGDRRDAKFTVLAESVRHHIKEEENEMLPKAKEVDVDFIALGQRMMERKQELKKNGVPPDAEHAMVNAAPHAGGDTPAANARRRTSPPSGRARKTTRRRASTARRRASR